MYNTYTKSYEKNSDIYCQFWPGIPDYKNQKAFFYNLFTWWNMTTITLKVDIRFEKFYHNIIFITKNQGFMYRYSLSHFLGLSVPYSKGPYTLHMKLLSLSKRLWKLLSMYHCFSPVISAAQKPPERFLRFWVPNSISQSEEADWINKIDYAFWELQCV